MFSARSLEGQDYMINKIQNPGKQIIGQLATHTFGIASIPKLICLLRDLAALPEPDESGMDSNSRILIGIRDDFFRRLRLPAYVNVFRTIFNFIIHKQHADQGYRDWLSWFIGECVSQGWEFARLDSPPSPLWDKNIPQIREKLMATLHSHYEVMQAKVGNSKDEKQKQKALQQFFGRILDTVDQEVRLWK